MRSDVVRLIPIVSPLTRCLGQLGGDEHFLRILGVCNSLRIRA